MNRNKRYYLIGLCMAFSAIATAHPPQGTLLDKIVAHVDGHIILASELENAYQQFLHQVGQETPDLKCYVLGRLILNKAILAKAEREGVTIRNEEIAPRLDQYMQHLVAKAGSEAALAQDWGQPIEVIKSELHDKLREQLVLERMQNQAIREISATPQEVQNFFDSLKGELPYYPAAVVVRQIVLYPQASQQEKDALLKQLASLRTRIQQGESFASLAREYSQDPGSAPQGGEVGFAKKGALAPAYEAAALALQPGELAEPVATRFGFHLIQLIAREGDRYNSRHILLQPSPGALDLEAPQAYLAQLRANILTGTVSFEEAAKASSQDPMSAPIGGLLTNASGSAQQVIDDLPPDIFFAIEALSPGDISEPLVFTTPNDQEAVRILFLEKKIAPHQASLAEDYEDIKQQLIVQKRGNAYQDWMQAVQAQALIQLAPEYQHCKLFQ